MTDGGYSFVHDPDIPITRKPVIWRREDTTRIINLTDAPRGFTDLRSLDFEAMGRVLFDSEDDAGRSVTVTGTFGTFFFLLDDPAAAKRPAVVIPIDPHYRSRWYEAGRFVAHHLGFRLPSRVPPVITPFRSLHLIRCLHAYDLHRAGADERRIAAVLINPRALTMPLDEWRDHTWRRTAKDWRDEGIALVEGGYLKLLLEG
ncbi:DUF2285 domain-containing protein [Acetobacter estunensis]|uniref:DUF2285 domain-containing protein n=1 Tax=Acetobacter estunensis TaxID=104097 RepID=UPI001C2D8150|nr:DUF2285 domain-containing protein [Acetobacter estunensis]